MTTVEWRSVRGRLLPWVSHVQKGSKVSRARAERLADREPAMAAACQEVRKKKE